MIIINFNNSYDKKEKKKNGRLSFISVLTITTQKHIFIHSSTIHNKEAFKLFMFSLLNNHLILLKPTRQQKKIILLKRFN